MVIGRTWCSEMTGLASTGEGLGERELGSSVNFDTTSCISMIMSEPSAILPCFLLSAILPCFLLSQRVSRNGVYNQSLKMWDHLTLISNKVLTKAPEKHNSKLAWRFIQSKKNFL